MTRGTGNQKTTDAAPWQRCFRNFSRVVSLAVILLWLGRGASAQNLSSNNLFVGYSFVGANLISGQHANLNGWSVSAEKKFLPFVGVVADVSGDYGSKDLPASALCPSSQAQCLVNSSVNEHFFQGGVRGSYALARVRPFVDILFGAVHIAESGPGLSDSRTLFAETFAVGFDCRVTRRLGWRLNVGVAETGLGLSRQNSFRGSTGLVIRF